MITIAYLKQYSDCIPKLAKIWHEVLGKIWMPEIGIEEIESLYYGAWGVMERLTDLRIIRIS